jgi:hypothetical protein
MLHLYQQNLAQGVTWILQALQPFRPQTAFKQTTTAAIARNLKIILNLRIEILLTI